MMVRLLGSYTNVTEILVLSRNLSTLNHKDDLPLSLTSLRVSLQTACLCPPQIHMLKPNHQCDDIWR